MGGPKRGAQRECRTSYFRLHARRAKPELRLRNVGHVDVPTVFRHIWQRRLPPSLLHAVLVLVPIRRKAEEFLTLKERLFLPKISNWRGQLLSAAPTLLFLTEGQCCVSCNIF